MVVVVIVASIIDVDNSVVSSGDQFISLMLEDRNGELDQAGIR